MSPRSAVVKYGRIVVADTEMDELRRTRYAFARRNDVAFMVTRCPEFAELSNVEATA